MGTSTMKTDVKPSLRAQVFAVTHCFACEPSCRLCLPQATITMSVQIDQLAATVSGQYPS